MRRFIEPWVQIAAPSSILDYGAGQGGFVDVINAPSATVRHSYDPAIPTLATLPQNSYDYVLCIDVLEHLEPDEVGAVLADVAKLSQNALFIVTTAPARAVLPDGRNAHTTVRPGRWWGEEIKKAFGHAAAVPVFRKNRSGFKTYASNAPDWLRFWSKLAVAELKQQTTRHP